MGKDEQLHAARRIMINVGNGAGKQPAPAASLKSVPGKSLFLKDYATW
jgi:hypothetical protein